MICSYILQKKLQPSFGFCSVIKKNFKALAMHSKWRFYSYLILALVAGLCVLSFKSGTKNALPTKAAARMKIEVWSDVVCPFCYIGKRRFEEALARFPHKDEVEVVWRSYELTPGLKTDPTQNINQFLARHKGISISEAKEMSGYATQMAAQTGLTYHFDKTVVANSFRAHCLIHFAKSKGKQSVMKERLFQAYFTEGRNIDDLATLTELAVSVGLQKGEVRKALENNAYAQAVQKDVAEAQRIGVEGVPHFVFPGGKIVSGAQDVAVFSKTLQAAWAAR